MNGSTDTTVGAAERVPGAVWTPQAPVEAVRPRRHGRLLRRLVRNPNTLAGAVLLALVVTLVLLAPLVTRFGPDDINVLALNQTPSARHLFGTDFLGRDVWTRVLYGGRLSLLVGLSVVALESSIGVTLGMVAGYRGRFIDGTVMRMMDVLLTIPGILLALAVIAALGPGLQSVVLALGLGGIPAYARLARGMTLTIREQEYVLAAHASGTTASRILLRHILPNVLAPLVVMATTSFGGAILAASALSYLGVGTQPPTADWGSLLSEGYEHMFQAWSEILFPGLAVSITVLGSNLLGDGLTDALNPGE
jgi:peptide/nickel transport system permease protein